MISYKAYQIMNNNVTCVKTINIPHIVYTTKNMNYKLGDGDCCSLRFCGTCLNIPRLKPSRVHPSECELLVFLDDPFGSLRCQTGSIVRLGNDFGAAAGMPQILMVSASQSVTSKCVTTP